MIGSLRFHRRKLEAVAVAAAAAAVGGWLLSPVFRPRPVLVEDAQRGEVVCVPGDPCVAVSDPIRVSAVDGVVDLEGLAPSGVTSVASPDGPVRMTGPSTADVSALGPGEHILMVVSGQEVVEVVVEIPGQGASEDAD